MIMSIIEIQLRNEEKIEQREMRQRWPIRNADRINPITTIIPFLANVNTNHLT